MMGELVYLMCAITSIFCAFMLLRGYREHRSRLLLLSTVCFLGLAVNSSILFVDMALLPEIDLRLSRTLAAFVSILVFLLGLIWESR